MNKNFLKKCPGVALAVICAAGLTACGGGGGNSVAGTYTMSSMEISGMTMDLENFASAAGMDADDINITLELNTDGSFVLDMEALDGGVVEGTWEGDTDSVDLTSDGETINCDVDGGVITMAEPSTGMSLVFEK